MHRVCGEKLEILVFSERILFQHFQQLPECGSLPHIKAGLGSQEKPDLVRLQLHVAGERKMNEDFGDFVNEPAGHQGNAIIGHQSPQDCHGDQHYCMNKAGHGELLSHVTQNRMSHLMANDDGELVVIITEVQHPLENENIPAWEDEGILNGLVDYCDSPCFVIDLSQIFVSI